MQSIQGTQQGNAVDSQAYLKVLHGSGRVPSFVSITDIGGTEVAPRMYCVSSMDSSYFTVRVAYNRVNEERFRWALQGASTPKFIWSADVRGLNTLSLTPLDMNQNPITGPNTAVYWIRVDLKPLDESELYMPVYGTLTLSNEIGTESHQVSNIPSPYWSGVIELDNPVMNGQLVVIQARIDYPDGSYDVAQGIGLEP